MIGATGREIPDPPTDPVERRRWKTIYYAELYGMPKEKIQEMMQQESRSHRSETIPKSAGVATYLAIGAITGAILLAIIAVAQGFSDMWR